MKSKYRRKFWLLVCIFNCVHFVYNLIYSANSTTANQTNKHRGWKVLAIRWLSLSLTLSTGHHIASFLLNHLSVFNLKSFIFRAKLIIPKERNLLPTLFKLDIFCTFLFLHVDEKEKERVNEFIRMLNFLFFFLLHGIIKCKCVCVCVYIWNQLVKIGQPLVQQLWVYFQDGNGHKKSQFGFYLFKNYNMYNIYLFMHLLEVLEHI